MPTLEEKVKKILVQATYAGGEPIREHWEQGGTYRLKPDQTPVTDADEQAEDRAATVILKGFPEHGILGEEIGVRNPGADITWVLDGIDGTRNFVNGQGNPNFALSIGVKQGRNVLAGAVYNPIVGKDGSLFYGLVGKGMFYNHKLVSVQMPNRQHMPSISFGYGRKEGMNEVAAILAHKAYSNRHSVRGFGVSAYELALVATGGLAAHISLGTEIWDYLGGIALVLARGGIVTDLQGNPWMPDQNYSIASIGDQGFHQELVELLQGVIELYPKLLT